MSEWRGSKLSALNCCLFRLSAQLHFFKKRSQQIHQKWESRYGSFPGGLTAILTLLFHFTFTVTYRVIVTRYNKLDYCILTLHIACTQYIYQPLGLHSFITVAVEVIVEPQET